MCVCACLCAVGGRDAFGGWGEMVGDGIAVEKGGAAARGLQQAD